LNTSGTNSEHSVASTTQMTISVTSAASQRGTFQPLICSAARRFTSGLPTTASTADMSMYTTIELKYQTRKRTAAATAAPAMNFRKVWGVVFILRKRG